MLLSMSTAKYSGIASSFGSGLQPLSLAAGSHLIELMATGYVPRAFEVNVVAGQVVLCQVSLTPRRCPVHC
jgi:hypothetical protein